MKKTIFSIIAIITLMFGHVLNVQATPPGVENCGQRLYSPKYLKNISKDELIEEYCACVTYVELSKKEFGEHPKSSTIRGAKNRAGKNITRVARYLGRNYQYTDVPKCDTK